MCLNEWDLTTICRVEDHIKDNPDITLLPDLKLPSHLSAVFSLGYTDDTAELPSTKNHKLGPDLIDQTFHCRNLDHSIAQRHTRGGECHQQYAVVSATASVSLSAIDVLPCIVEFTVQDCGTSHVKGGWFEIMYDDLTVLQITDREMTEMLANCKWCSCHDKMLSAAKWFFFFICVLLHYELMDDYYLSVLNMSSTTCIMKLAGY